MIISGDSKKVTDISLSPPGFPVQKFPAIRFEGTSVTSGNLISVEPGATPGGSRFAMSLVDNPKVTNPLVFKLCDITGVIPPNPCPTATGEIEWPEDTRPQIATATFHVAGIGSIPLVAYNVATSSVFNGTSFTPMITSFQLIKAIDLNSKDLNVKFFAGSDLGSVEIAIGDPGAAPLVTYELEHVKMTSLEYVADEFGATPSETIALAFSRICISTSVGIGHTCYDLTRP